MNKLHLATLVLVSCTVLFSCTASSKMNAVKQRNQARINSATAESTGYRYPSIYINVGTVVPDTTGKSY